MARNYVKFFLVNGYYDDGSGGQIAFGNFFQNEFEAENFFSTSPLPWLPGEPRFADKIYIPFTKLLLQEWLNKYASLAQTTFIEGLTEPFIFFESPRKILDEEDPDDVGKPS